MANQETYHWNNSGTKQSERLPRELSGNYVKIDERSFEDLIKQVAEYAKHLHYYNSNNEKDGDWSNFFSEIYDYERQEVDMAHLENLMENASVKPHLALMLAFLKLFQIQQENLNGITERHLDFYYKDILGFEPRKGEAGKVTVFLELNKNASHAFIPKGTLFDAGKDTAGKPIRYEAADEMRVNRIKIASVKAYSGTDGLVDMQFSDSGKKAEEENTGAASDSSDEQAKPYKIIIASPILNQLDGTKSIKFLDKDDGAVELTSDCKLECTANQGWKTIDDISAINEAIIPYDPTIHGEGFGTTHPLLRFSTSDATEFNNLISNIKNLTVTVLGSQNCMIENKYGTFLNRAGLYPFGTIAAQGDWFKIILPFKDATIKGTNILIDEGKANDYLWAKTQFEKTTDNAIELDILNSEINQLYSLNTAEFDQTAFASEYALAMARFVVNRNESTIPKKPFIPEFKEPVKVTYSVSDSTELQLFSQTPFGIERIAESSNCKIPKVIPFICNDNESGKCQTLFIGLENAEPDDLLNLYLKIDPYCSPYHDDVVQWSYLAGSLWKGYTNSNLLKDGTDKLRRSGIITLRLPADADTIDGLKWIKLSKSTASDDGKPFGNILEMRTQALELKCSTQSEGAASVGAALPFGSIAKAVSSITGIKKIEQAYDGEPGKCDESDGHFKCRVSERLRHKGRAWTGWDYERLVLEKFPQVAAAKCLSCCNAKGEFEAGTVTIMLLPGKDGVAHNPLQPKIDGRTIAEAQSYLESIAPPFVSIHVINPDYVPIEIECTLKLREGFNDQEYYKALLNEQIISYLSPWSNGEIDMEFSTAFNESGLVEFIDSQHFVDNVESLIISINGKTVGNGFYFTLSNPTQILTSAKEHKNIQFR